MTVQLSILKIVGYGPWTLTLGSDREHELQMLQASLYQEIQRLFSERGCLVFSNRADELFALSTGLDLKSHKAIQDELISKFQNVRLRIAIGSGATPLKADKAAHESVLNSHQDTKSETTTTTMMDKKYMIFGSTLADTQTLDTNAQSSHVTTIMHMDIDGLSSRNSSPYEMSLLIFGLYSKMSTYFYNHESLAFFMGGDNFMIVSSESAKMAAREFVDMIQQQDGIKLNCGIGCAKTARDAACLATESLDMIRKMRDEHDATLSSVVVDDDDDQITPNITYDKTRPSVYEHATKKYF